MFARSTRPPSATLISARFGFPAPPALVALLRFIHDETGEVAGGEGSYFQSITGLYLCADDMRYEQTPPELFPFASAGVDGIHFGYVIHDPKLGPEFPVGCLCPMESDGVMMAGRDTASAFELFLSQQLQDEVTAEEAERIARAAAALGVEPAASKAAQEPGWGFGIPSDDLPALVVEIPRGWMRVATGDGIGVLGPTGAFRRSRRDEGPTRGAKDWGDRAERWLSAGAPASALVVLRNAIWSGLASPSEAADMLQRAYGALGRPLLADVVRKHAARWK